MDQFIATAVFILPGVLMYFWLQAFGINPVAKHSVPEFAAIAALMWLPVSLTNIFLCNLIGKMFRQPSVNSLSELMYRTTSDLKFLALFFAMGILSSFAVGYLYAKFILPIQYKIINNVRKERGLEELSEIPNVWDEFFSEIYKEEDENQDEYTSVEKEPQPMYVRMFKIDKPEESIVRGVVIRASRPFESERALVLVKTDDLKESDEDHIFVAGRSYVDIKAGIIIQQLDVSKPRLPKIKVR